MDIVVVGGGAAGMMAAVAAAGAQSDPPSAYKVYLIEKNEKLGKKLFITGKGRCNVTNACEVEDFFQNVMEHAKFLYSAVYGFDNHAVMDFFEKAGCPLKIERGQRVFPRSDHSSDIIKALEQELKRLGVQILLNTEVRAVRTMQLESQGDHVNSDAGESVDKYHKKKQSSKKKQTYRARITGIALYDKTTRRNSELNVDRLIVATGGCSYILTGSTGDGYRFAGECGHSITPTMPALVPFSVKEEWCYKLQGLSLKNVKVSLELDGKQIYSDLGEMLFTHYGVSGPLILSASSHYVHKASSVSDGKLYIDLKPALTHEQLDKRILRDFDDNKNKQFKNVISEIGRAHV